MEKAIMIGLAVLVALLVVGLFFVIVGYFRMKSEAEAASESYASLKWDFNDVCADVLVLKKEKFNLVQANKELQTKNDILEAELVNSRVLLYAPKGKTKAQGVLKLQSQIKQFLKEDDERVYLTVVEWKE